MFLYNSRDVSSTTEHSLTFANPTGKFRDSLIQSGAEVKDKSPQRSPPLLSDLKSESKYDKNQKDKNRPKDEPRQRSKDDRKSTTDKMLDRDKITDRESARKDEKRARKEEKRKRREKEDREKKKVQKTHDAKVSKIAKK